MDDFENQFFTDNAGRELEVLRNNITYLSAQYYFLIEREEFAEAERTLSDIKDNQSEIEGIKNKYDIDDYQFEDTWRP